MAEKTLETGTELRPERIQTRLKSERVQTRLKSEWVQARLKELPGWEAAKGGKAIERTYLFPTLRVAVAFVALAAEIGEANGYLPDIDVRHLEVTLRVATNAEAGVTDLDFDVALWGPLDRQLVAGQAASLHSGSLSRRRCSRFSCVGGRDSVRAGGAPSGSDADAHSGPVAGAARKVGRAA